MLFALSECPDAVRQNFFTASGRVFKQNSFKIFELTDPTGVSKKPLRGYTFRQVFIFGPKFLVFVEYMGSTSNLAARQSGFWRIAFDLKLWQE